MTTRRRFIEIMPLAGAALLAACSEKKAAAPEPAAPLPAPVPDAKPPAPAAAAEPAAAPAAAAGLVDEKSDKAVSLGYVSDAARADGTKYKTYAAGQACSNCALFQGKAGEPSGPCPLFAGSAVSAKGWCSAYNKKLT